MMLDFVYFRLTENGAALRKLDEANEKDKETLKVWGKFSTSHHGHKSIWYANAHLTALTPAKGKEDEFIGGTGWRPADHRDKMYSRPESPAYVPDKSCKEGKELAKEIAALPRRIYYSTSDHCSILGIPWGPRPSDGRVIFPSVEEAKDGYGDVTKILCVTRYTPQWDWAKVQDGYELLDYEEAGILFNCLAEDEKDNAYLKAQMGPKNFKNRPKGR